MLRRIFHSPVAMTWLNQVVSFGWMLLVIPLVLLKWNSAEVSLWLSFSMLLSLGLLGDLGFRPTVTRAVSYAVAGVPMGNENSHVAGSMTSSGDTAERFWRLFSTVRFSYWVLTGGALVLCLFPGVLLVRNIIALGGERTSDWCAYGAMILQVLLALNMGRYSGILEGMDQVASVNRLQATINLVRVPVVALLVWAGFGVLAVSLAGIGLLLVQDRIMRSQALRAVHGRYGHESFKQGFDMSIFRWLWAPAWRSGVISVGGYLIGQGTTIVAAQLPDPAIIASYLLTMRILGFAGQIAKAPLYARLPQLNRLRAQEDIGAFRQFFARRMALILALGAIAIIGINLVGGPLLDLISNSSHGLLVGRPLWILSLWLFLEVHHSAHAQAYMTTNHVPFMWPALLSGAIVLGAGHFAAKAHGVVGLALVLLLVQLAFNNWYPVYLNLRSLHWQFAEYCADLLSAAVGFFKTKPII